jgi:hypothetical protein
MEKLNIISEENKIILTKQECINLELKFNVSKYGKEWSHIGDRLYYFAHPRNDKDRHNYYILTPEEFSFINSIIDLPQ